MYGIKTISAAIAAACMLAACGGGGGDSTDTPAGGGGDGTDTPTAASIKGVWTGSITSTVGPRDLTWDKTSVALDDGRLFVMTSEFYSANDAPERNLIGALVVGQGSAENNSYAFTNGQEFPFEDIVPEWRQRPASLTADYGDSSLNGRITYEATPQRDFTSSRAASYASAASLDDLATVFNNPEQRSIQGVFYTPNPAGGSIRKEVQIIVGADGALSTRGGEPACQVSGSLTARSDMKVYDATINFGAGDCPYASGTSLSGVAFLKPTVVTTRNAQVVSNRFHLLATNAGRDMGTVFAQVLMADTAP